MAKKQKTPRYLPEFKSVKTLRPDEYILFRDTRGRLTKFDGRKKLLAEVWKAGRKTDLYYLNSISISKGPMPRKFDKKKTENFIRFHEYSRQRQTAPPKKINQLEIKLNAHFTIQDNLLAKADDLLSFIVKRARKSISTYVEITIKFKTTEGFTRYEVIESIIRESTKDNAAMAIARMVIARLYSNELRMSSLKDSSSNGGIGERGKYLRSAVLQFQWYEIKRAKARKNKKSNKPVLTKGKRKINSRV